MTCDPLSALLGGMATLTKMGRKQKHHVTSYSGETIVGLSRRPSDGRWRVIGTQTTFTEPDERRAVAKFRALQRGESEPTVALQFATAAAVPVYNLNRAAPKTSVLEVSEAELFAWFAEQLRERPQYVAAQTGIEQLGYLERLKPPKPLPSLADLERNWTDHADVRPEEKRKVLAAWKDFVAVTRVEGLRGISPEVGLQYKDDVAKRGWSNKSMRHRFNRVRRILSFAIERTIAVEECSRALACLAFKLKRHRKIVKPNPIAPAEFAALLSKAQGDDKAMLYLMLNCGLYLQEAVRVRWDELDGGCLVTQRQKEGECLRVAVLWQQTIDALNKVERKGEYVFVAEHGLPLTVSGAGKRFRKVRTAAGLPSVSGSQMRDGAYQAMAEANINDNLCKLLVGHSSGLRDNYVLRNPKMVAPACEAIAKAYGMS